MTQRQIIQRIVLSVLLLGIAFVLSCTGSALEAHQTTGLFDLPPKTSVTNVSKSLHQRVTSAHSPLFEQPACPTCNLPYTNPTLTLTFMAIIANFVVMAGLIYGFGYIASWTTY